MRFELIAILVAAATASAQQVVGTAYGFGAGATGGGSAAAVTPTSNDELAKLLSDDVPRTILITKAFDFRGKSATGAGCDRKSCSEKNGGQFYLGTLSCGTADNIAVNSITYDAAGTSPLSVKSNKSILGVGGKGAIVGTGLMVEKGATNIIIQGIHITNINPGVVWGGDGISLQGGNSKVWIDHCKFSLIGRMFVVSHYEGSSATLSNNEFDGKTTTSATCNNNHYWTMMFYGNGVYFTLDKNYFHDVSGRAPKLGQPGETGYYQAINNYFENMKGHAFDAYEGAHALVEGNVFNAVQQPSTDQAAKISTFVVNAGSACNSVLGRSCLENSVDSASGKLNGGSSIDFLSMIGKNAVSKPLAVSEVAAHVKSNAGPANLGAASGGQAQGPPAGTDPTTLMTSLLPTKTSNVEEFAVTTKKAKVQASPISSSSSPATASRGYQCGRKH